MAGAFTLVPLVRNETPLTRRGALLPIGSVYLLDSGNGWRAIACCHVIITIVGGLIAAYCQSALSGKRHIATTRAHTHGWYCLTVVLLLFATIALIVVVTQWIALPAAITAVIMGRFLAPRGRH